MLRRPHRSPRFPYTTLFRSPVRLAEATVPERRERAAAALVASRRGSRRHESLARALGDLGAAPWHPAHGADRKSTRLNSSHLGISYAVFCLKKKITTTTPAT